VTDAGLLRIDWPRLVESKTAVELDLVLVTANDPEISSTSTSTLSEHR
jgi:hypothetical protein